MNAVMYVYLHVQEMLQDHQLQGEYFAYSWDLLTQFTYLKPTHPVYSSTLQHFGSIICDHWLTSQQHRTVNSVVYDPCFRQACFILLDFGV